MTKCNGEIWDYEKVFYKLRMRDGSIRWAWPNAGKLTDMDTKSKTSGSQIPIEDIDSYIEADDVYFKMIGL